MVHTSVCVLKQFSDVFSSSPNTELGTDNGETQRLVVEEREKRERIIATIHDPSHVGVNRTLDMIASKYYWPGLTTDVKKYVSIIYYDAGIMYVIKMPQFLYVIW